MVEISAARRQPPPAVQPPQPGVLGLGEALQGPGEGGGGGGEGGGDGGHGRGGEGGQEVRPSLGDTSQSQVRIGGMSDQGAELETSSLTVSVPSRCQIK